jgi:hypothetical protein
MFIFLLMSLTSKIVSLFVAIINAFATSTRITANAMARKITEASYQIELILIIAPVHHPKTFDNFLNFLI